MGGTTERQSDKATKGQANPRSKLVQGAMLLGLAAVISKLLGTLQKIPLQNVAGDAVFGIYNAVYPLYILILFAATAGFPVAVSKFVAEQVRLGAHREARRIAYVSGVVLMCAGALLFLALYFGAEQIAAWIGIERTASAIRSVSFALLVSPVLAVLRGYFQGYQNMLPTAVSQVAEQFIRVITMVALLLYMTALAYDDARIAAGATFGSVTGAAAGLAVMAVFWRRAMREGQEPGGPAQQEQERKGQSSPAAHTSAWQWAKRIALYAIPVCLGAIVVPLLNLVDTFTLPRLLEASLGSEGEAMRAYGLYNRGLPLVQLVVMVASSMSAALVPAIAEAKVSGRDDRVRSRAEMAVRVAWLVGLGASFGLAFAAVPINIMLYRTEEASWTMAVLAFTALFSTLNAVSASVLQGVGALRTPTLALLVAIALKALGNVLLLPRWGIDGAALSAVVAYAAAAGLNLVQLRRCTGVRFALRPYAISPALGVGLMGGCLAALQLLAMPAAAAWHVPLRWSASAIALISVAGGAAVYGLALLRSGSVSRAELQETPELARKLAPLLNKLKR
ncbi:putative polysaccharide biosynthesis protein [Paenibacillus whitsoniae]|uniref:Polysaccharide biosynthesis protein n=1 Tax=Paenibacillus whitsoniae TaxID=2496558 RepID=A0A3S0CT30_9BACL|nr:polysaccharide biosynthesis protein [Paenibacillus whitsoniae]RTE08069.1 polysaccharide biosynthesis protein [Paenibacillus whitsoniae]